MARLFGRDWTRSQLLSMVGDISQLAGVRLGELADGFERGLRVADCRTGGGLNFTVLLDRGMDIGAAEYRGIPLAWISGTTFARPEYHERDGLGWLRTFGGGLVTGCGLDNVGAPAEDAGETLGLHGRLSHIPARNVCTGSDWQGDEYRFWVQGKMRQARVFAENLELTRRVSASLGGAALTIEDTVENLGDAPAPLLILYHVNIGFPVLSPESEIVAEPHPVQARDAVAEQGLDRWMRFQEPVAGFSEQVYFHDIPPDSDGMATATLVNPWLGVDVRVRFRKAELPNMIEWKMLGKGTYVLGFEPANALVLGRVEERARGTLQMIEQGEKRSFLVEVGVVDRR